MRRRLGKQTRFYRLLGSGSILLAFLLIAGGVLLWSQDSGSGLGILQGNFFGMGEQKEEITCTTPPQEPGNHTETITSVGLERSFIVHLPASYGRHAQPLLINFHGYNGAAENFMGRTQMNGQADAHGFIAVYPQGSEEPSSWNAGVGVYGPTALTDDIQFTRDMLAMLEQNYCIDAQRIYITGFSLGGGLAYRLACVMSDRIAAIATVAGAFYAIPEGCQPSRPMPVLEVHGELDDAAIYTGNGSLLTTSVQDYLNGWLERDSCAGEPETFFQEATVTGIEWTDCADGVSVRHYRVGDGQHSWAVLPAGSTTIDTSTVIWEFLSKYSLPVEDSATETPVS